VPIARTDRRLIAVTALTVVLAAAFFAAVLILASGGGSKHVRETSPLYLGPRTDLKASLDLGSPLYFANPFGGRGFWLDREQGRFVALDVGVPGDTSCSIVWRGRINTYLDCKGRHLSSDQMARHPVSVSIAGVTKGGVYADLRALDPPPSPIN